MLCHGTVCVVGKIRDLILQLSKSSIYSTKPFFSSSRCQSQNSGFPCNQCIFFIPIDRSEVNQL
ncbi:hypothetical protein C2U48_20835 [Escherichia coli]|nr:hypothetical protein C2U48_20835 [Escherichia coli]